MHLPRSPHVPPWPQRIQQTMAAPPNNPWLTAQYTGGKMFLAPTQVLVQHVGKALATPTERACVLKLPAEQFPKAQFDFDRTVVPFMGQLAVRVKNWLVQHQLFNAKTFPQTAMTSSAVIRSSGKTDRKRATQSVNYFHVDGNQTPGTAALALGYGPRQHIPLHAGNLQLFNLAAYHASGQYPSLTLEQLASVSFDASCLPAPYVATFDRTHQDDICVALVSNSPSEVLHRGSAPIPSGGQRTFSRFYLGNDNSLNPKRQQLKVI
jgi:hypothetical protein